MMPLEEAAARVEIHVAYWNLAHHRHRLTGCVSVLSAAEQARARRLALPFLRERFILRRGLLRLALAPIVGSDPADLRFVQGPYGKPALVGGNAAPPPSFSLSRSYDGLLVAVAARGAIGCDLEQVRVVPEAKAMIRQWFAADEREALSRIGEAGFDRAFLAAWVRKEATLKANGVGLQGSLDIETGLARCDGAATTVVLDGQPLWLANVDQASEWVGAVAADRPFTIAFTDHG